MKEMTIWSNCSTGCSDEVYKDIPNSTSVAGDNLIIGSTEQEHDEAFINIFKATHKNNVSLNSGKLGKKLSTHPFSSMVMH